jgi:hypothetical protein
MDLLKKHLFFLACIGVVVLALVGLIPGCLWNSTNQTKMQKKASSYDSIQRLLTGQQVKGKTLVPNPDAINEIEKYQDKVRTEFASTKEVAKEINMREPLLENVFPLPKSRDLPFIFQREYREAFQEMVKELKGAPPLDKATLDELVEKIRMREAARRPIKTLLGEEEQFREEEKLDTPERQLARQNQARLEYSRNAGIFLTLDSFDRGQWAFSPDRPSPADMWMGQIAYWIQRDIVDLLKDLNKDSNSVLDAPAKRLVWVKVERQYVGEGQYEAMAAARTEDQSVVIHDTSVSVTGRLSNPLFDVVHFEFEVVIDSRRINSLLRRLVGKNLYCILRVDYEAVNHIQAMEQGFMYGTMPVVKLTVAGEAIFLRQAYADMMPLSIKELLPGFTEETPEEG